MGRSGRYQRAVWAAHPALLAGDFQMGLAGFLDELEDQTDGFAHGVL